MFNEEQQGMSIRINQDGKRERGTMKENMDEMRGGDGREGKG